MPSITCVQEPLAIIKASSAQNPTTSAASVCIKASTSAKPCASTKGPVRARRERKRRKEHSPELSPLKAKSPKNEKVESEKSVEVVCDLAEPMEALTITAEKQEENEAMQQGIPCLQELVALHPFRARDWPATGGSLQRRPRGGSPAAHDVAKHRSERRWGEKLARARHHRQLRREVRRVGEAGIRMQQK